jgi:hypothetical protein
LIIKTVIMASRIPHATRQLISQRATAPSALAATGPARGLAVQQAHYTSQYDALKAGSYDYPSVTGRTLAGTRVSKAHSSAASNPAQPPKAAVAASATARYSRGGHGGETPAPHGAAPHAHPAAGFGDAAHENAWTPDKAPAAQPRSRFGVFVRHV